jgi:hypothetical protein
LLNLLCAGLFPDLDRFFPISLSTAASLGLGFILQIWRDFSVRRSPVFELTNFLRPASAAPCGHFLLRFSSPGAA